MHYPQVVRDEQIGEAHLRAASPSSGSAPGPAPTSSAEVGSSQIRNSGLLARRACDRDALPLTAGELVKLLTVLGGRLDEAKQLGDALVERRWIGDEPWVQNGFGDDVGNAPAWVQARVRVLKKSSCAARPAQVVGRQCDLHVPDHQPPHCRCSARRGQTISRATVDLPQPDSPTSASVSPLRISKLTSLTACRKLCGLRSITRLSHGAETSKVLLTFLRLNKSAHAQTFPSCSQQAAIRTKPASGQDMGGLAFVEHFGAAGVEGATGGDGVEPRHGAIDLD